MSPLTLKQFLWLVLSSLATPLELVCCQQLGEALYTTYTKDHECDWSTATKLAYHAGNILKNSTILAVVKHELWATVLLELGEWMLCCYDVREVLNCLQLCERLVTMISLPFVLPWNPPGEPYMSLGILYNVISAVNSCSSVFLSTCRVWCVTCLGSICAVYNGSFGLQTCSSIDCRLSSLLVVLQSSNILLGLCNSVLDASRSVADLPVLSCSAWKYTIFFLGTICEFPSRYGYVRCLTLYYFDPLMLFIFSIVDCLKQIIYAGRWLVQA